MADSDLRIILKGMMDREEKLKLLKDLGGIPEEEFDRLYVNSINDINNEFKKLRDFFNQNDMQGVRMAAHAIKGISANYRIKTVYELCKLLGPAIKEKRGNDAVEGLIDKLESEILGLKSR